MARGADRGPRAARHGGRLRSARAAARRHDTACAVHALSEGSEDATAFISCGSWTLVGAETPAPVLDNEVFRTGFTNETRTDGGNRLLKNVTGLWLLQECQRKWTHDGASVDIETLKQEAAGSVSLGVVVDVNAEQFVLPSDMPAAICDRTHELYGVEPTSRGQLVRLILESLAVEHARSIDQVDAATKFRHPVVNLIGGGSRNELLAQMTASACGRPLVAGPAEASAIGNALAQLETLELIAAHQRQQIVRESIALRHYEPRGSAPWQQLRQRLDEALASH
jgi:rhamnulokinase